MRAIPVTFEADSRGYIIEALELHPDRAIRKYAAPIADTEAGSFMRRLAMRIIPEGNASTQHREAFLVGGYLAIASFQTADVDVTMHRSVLARFAHFLAPHHFNASQHIALAAQRGNAAHREFGQAYDALLHHIIQTPQPSTIGTSLYNGIGLAFFQLDVAWRAYRNERIDREVAAIISSPEWSRLLD
jgi:hypothetical protein